MNDDYLQPDFYRFNSDSLDLIRWVQNLNVKPQSILDLGSGCGILGIELSRLLLPERVCLVELQEAFRYFLEINCDRFLPQGIKKEIHISSFNDFGPRERFDLIVCNPPYYLPGRGEVSQDLLRANCRAFLVDSWNVLLKKIEMCLSQKGHAFIVIKNDKTVLNEIGQQSGHQLHLKHHEIGLIVVLEFTLIG